MDMMTYWENERRKLLGLPLIADTGKSGTALDAPDSAVKKQAGEEEAPPFALNPEEEKHQSKKLTGENANAYEGHLQQFKQRVDAAKSAKELLSICGLSASLLFEEATKSYADGNLYFSRLKMRVFLKKNLKEIAERLNINNSSKILENCLQNIESESRNWVGINFGDNMGRKKILISGFDPFDKAETNFSAELALRFHNKELTSSDGTKIGLIQAATFPVLYSEFDAGIVEDFFGQHIGYVDAILTCSLEPNIDYFAIERFAANWRESATFPDNFDEMPRSKSIIATSNAKNYLEDSLPIEQLILSSELSRNNFTRYRQDYIIKYKKDDEAAKEAATFRENNYNTKTLQPPTEKMVEGSGGDFLSNEIFYRVAYLRGTSPLKTGHIHVPKKASPAHISTFEILLKRLLDTL